MNDLRIVYHMPESKFIKDLSYFKVLNVDKEKKNIDNNSDSFESDYESEDEDNQNKF